MHKTVFQIIYETIVISSSIDINTVPDAIAYLFMYYFLFDLKYPETSQQVLGWFHEFLFKFEEIKFLKNNKHDFIASQIKNY